MARICYKSCEEKSISLRPVRESRQVRGDTETMERTWSRSRIADR